MKWVLSFTLLLAGGLSAQTGVTFRVSALDGPGVFARASRHFQESRIPPGPIVAPKTLLVQAAGNGAAAGALFRAIPGGNLGFQLKGSAWSSQSFSIPGEAGTVRSRNRPGPAGFRATLLAGSDISVLARISFQGKIPPGGSASAVFGDWKKSPGEGNFSLSTEIPLRLRKGVPLSLPLSLGFSVRSRGWARNECRASLEVRILPLLRFSSFGKGCRGRIGVGEPPIFGEEFRITLSGGVPSSPCFLLAGNSNKVFLGVPLPLDLGVLGAPGCFLYTNIAAAVPALTGPKGEGELRFFIPPASRIPFFPEVFFQWVQASPAVKLGVQTSDGAVLSRE